MIPPRVVVTGIGVISSIGCGREEFWRALAASSADILSAGWKPALPDFDPRRYLTQKGVKLISRAGQMAASATSLALMDAQLDAAALPSERVGVVIGSAYACVNSMVAFDREAHEVGARFVSATLFPDTLLNAPAGHVSILFGWMGVNSTICAGAASSLEAVRYACDALRRGDVDVMVVGGCEEWSQWVARGMGQWVNGAMGQETTLMGEGAAMFVLERWEDAQRRAAKVWAEIAGCGASFVPHGSDEGTVAELQSQAMRQALASASLSTDDISEVFVAPTSPKRSFGCRHNVLERVFGEKARTLPVRCLPRALGELCGATGAMLAVAAMSSLQRDAQAVLVNAFSGEGHNAAVAMKKG
jgi:3-oxoacyl-[acyl-carrier-protein] synthase II